MKKTLTLLLKLIVTLAIFYLLFQDQDFDKIYSDILQIDLTLFLTACLLYSSVFYLFAFRWNFINYIFRISMSIQDLFKHHIIGFFLSNALPSTIGGDFWRIKALYPHTEKKSQAFIIPLIERLSGFIAVYIMGLISIVIFSDYIKMEEQYKVWAIIISILAALLLLLFLSKKVILFIKERLAAIKNERLQQFFDVLLLIEDHKKQFLFATLLSLSAQVIYGIASFLVIIAMGEYIAVGYIIFIVPMIYFASIIPISINGYGLREGTFVFFLTLLGIANKNALSISLMLTIMQITVSLVGGVLFLLDKKRKQA